MMWPHLRHVVAMWGSLRCRMRVLLFCGVLRVLHLGHMVRFWGLGSLVLVLVAILRASCVYLCEFSGFVLACCRSLFIRCFAMLFVCLLGILFEGFWAGRVYKSMVVYGFLEAG